MLQHSEGRHQQYQKQCKTNICKPLNAPAVICMDFILYIVKIEFLTMGFSIPLTSYYPSCRSYAHMSGAHSSWQFRSGDIFAQHTAEMPDLKPPFQYKFYQILHICESIIISINALTVINDTVSFIRFQTVQELFFPIAFYEQIKTVWLYFLKQTSLAGFFAFIAMVDVFPDGTQPVFASIVPGAIAGITSITMLVFCTQAACQATTGNSQFSFHRILLFHFSYRTDSSHMKDILTDMA